MTVDIAASVAKVAKVFEVSQKKRVNLEARHSSLSKQLSVCQQQTISETLCLARNGAYVATLRHALDSLSREAGPFLDMTLPKVQASQRDLDSLLRVYMSELVTMTRELAGLTSFLNDKQHGACALLFNLQNTLKSKTQRSADDSDTAQRLVAQEAEVDQQICSQAIDLSNIRAQLDVVQTELNQVKGRDEQGARDLKGIEDDLKDSQTNMDALTAQQSTRLKELNTSQSQLFTTTLETKSCKKTIEDSVASVQDKLQKINDTIFDLQKTVNEAQIKRGLLLDGDKKIRQTAKGLETKIVETREELGRNQAIERSITQQLVDSKKRVDAADKAAAESTSKVSGAKARLAENVAAQNALADEIPGLHSRQVALQGHYNSALAIAKQEFESARHPSDDLARKLDAALKSQQELEDLQRKTKAELDEFQGQRASLKERLSVLKRECQHNMEEKLRSDIATIERETAELYCQVDQLNKANTASRPKSRYNKGKSRSLSITVDQQQIVEKRADVETSKKMESYMEQHKREIDELEYTKLQQKEACELRLDREKIRLGKMLEAKQKASTNSSSLNLRVNQLGSGLAGSGLANSSSLNLRANQLGSGLAGSGLAPKKEPRAAPNFSSAAPPLPSSQSLHPRFLSTGDWFDDHGW